MALLRVLVYSLFLVSCGVQNGADSQLSQQKTIPGKNDHRRILKVQSEGKLSEIVLNFEERTISLDKQTMNIDKWVRCLGLFPMPTEDQRTKEEIKTYRSVAAFAQNSIMSSFDYGQDTTTKKFLASYGTNPHSMSFASHAAREEIVVTAHSTSAKAIVILWMFPFDHRGICDNRSVDIIQTNYIP